MNCTLYILKIEFEKLLGTSINYMYLHVNCDLKKNKNKKKPILPNMSRSAEIIKGQM